MGLDFIRRAASTFKKSWNRGASELARPTLFTRYPDCRTRSVVAVLEENANLSAGMPLAAHLDGQTLALVHETTRVAVVTSPPHDLFEAIRGIGGCATSHVVQVNPSSGTANVEFE